MADYQTAIRREGALGAAIDEGLRAYMNKIYGLMGVAMAITGLVAYAVGTNDALLGMFRDPATLAPTGLGWIAMFSPLGLILILSFGVHKMSVSTMQALFWGIAVTMGLSMAYIFAMYTSVSIAQTFFVTSIAFLGLSLYGYTTKKDLSGWGTFLIMGVIGLIVASVVNIFLGSPALQFAISILGVLIFAGLIAFDTQRLKNEYVHFSQMGQEGAAILQKGAIMGALSLYINFVNLFQFLLMFLGNRE